MKNSLKRTLILAIISMLCLGLTGCGKMTTEKLLSKMIEATGGRQMTCAELAADIEASYSMDISGADLTLDLSMSMDMKEYVNADPFKGYMEGTIHLAMLNQDIDSDMKIYMKEEDGGISTYTYTGINDEWTHTNGDFDLKEYKKLLEQDTVSRLFTGTETNAITMEEETSVLDGTEVYVLRGNFMGEDVKNLLSGAGASLFMNENMDFDTSFEDISVPMICYVDTATYLPLQIEMDIEGMETIVNQMLESELGELEGTEDLGLEISVSTCHMVMKNFSYDPQEIPEVPSDAIDAIAFREALENVGTMLADGSYVLKSGSTALKLSVPDGFMAQDTADGTVSMVSSDGYRLVTYSLVPELYVEESLSTILDTYTGMFSAMGMELNRDSQPQTISSPLGDSDGYQMTSEGVGIYYTSVPVNSFCLYVLAVDLGGNWSGADEALGSTLAGVRELSISDIQ